MNGILLQAPGNRFGTRDAEDAPGLMRRCGDSADRRKAIGDLARMRCSDEPAESGGRVLLTGVWGPGSPDLYPTDSVHRTGGDYGCGYNEGQGDDGALDSFCYDDEPYAHGQPTGAASATRGLPERRGGPTPCWNEQCERKHDAQLRYSL